jgi:hypothetical protein
MFKQLVKKPNMTSTEFSELKPLMKRDGDQPPDDTIMQEEINKQQEEVSLQQHIKNIQKYQQKLNGGPQMRNSKKYHDQFLEKELPNKEQIAEELGGADRLKDKLKASKNEGENENENEEANSFGTKFGQFLYKHLVVKDAPYGYAP